VKSKNPRSVLIVGTYSGLNKGDRLMQEVVINELKKNNYTPVLSSPFPEIDENIYPDVKIAKSRRRNLPLSCLRCLLLFLLPKIFQERYARNNSELMDYINADFVVDTSGDMLTEDYGPHIAISHLIPLIYCVLLQKKFIVLAQSIGPFKYVGFLFDWVLSKAEKVSTRDEITYKYLNKRGYSNLIKVADLGFLLQPRLFEYEQLSIFANREKKKIIGICPSALFFEKFSKEVSQINPKNFCLMLDSVAKENNLSYLFLPHVMTPSKKMDDSIFSRTLVDMLVAECEIADANLSPAEIKFLIGKLDGMVSFRMHGSIAALDSIIPTITVSYSHKAIGLHQNLGLDDWVVACNAGLNQNLCNKMVELIKNSSEIRDCLKNVLPEIRKKAQLNLRLIREM